MCVCVFPDPAAVTGRLSGSVAQWSACSPGMREALGSVGPCAFSYPVTFGDQCGSVLGLRAAKGLSHRFRHGSERIRGRI